MIRILIAVFIGSGLGGVCRYLLGNLVNGFIQKIRFPIVGFLPGFPWGTFAVNILGCFVIGAIYGLIDRHVAMTDATRLFLTTGFCGGLTTFSTFSHENVLLFGSGNHAVLLVYAAASLAAGFAAAWLGHAAVR